jgi:hypothetical protein
MAVEELEQETQLSPAIGEGVVIDLRDARGPTLDLRGLDRPDAPRLTDLAPVADPNRVPLVGTRWVLLVALALLNVLDLITTRAVLAAGGSEANPLMSSVIDHTWTPLLVKTAGVALVAVVVNSCPADSKVVNRALAATVVVYSAIVSWNLINLIQLP